MILLFVVSITCIPNTLNAGNNTGTIKNAFSDVLKFRLGKQFLQKPNFEEIEGFTIFFSKIFNPIIANAMNAMLNEIRRGMVANGVS
jgi:hypothetical protein